MNNPCISAKFTKNKGHKIDEAPKLSAATIHCLSAKDAKKTPANGRPRAYTRQLTLEIMGAIVAVVGFLSAGEETLTLENIAFAHAFFNDGQPPVDAEEDHQADTPFNKYPNQIDPAKNKKPKAAMLAFDIGQLDTLAAALGTLLIQCHKFYLCVWISDQYHHKRDGPDCQEK